MSISYLTKKTETQTDEQYMHQAILEAQKAYAKNEVPVGAVVVYQNQIIARTHNLTETLTDVTAHAEMQAITAATEHIGGKYLIDCTMYVTLEPCVMCAGALGWSQVSRIVFGANDPRKGFSNFTPNVLHPKTVVVKNILGEECKKMMSDFFKTKR